MRGMNPVILYINTSSREEAIFISHELLRKKYIACANIVDNVTSLYHWQGEIESSNEVIIIAKTFDSYGESVAEVVKQFHSYQCPAILTLPLAGVNQDYLDWMKTQLIDENER